MKAVSFDPASFFASTLSEPPTTLKMKPLSVVFIFSALQAIALSDSRKRPIKPAIRLPQRCARTMDTPSRMDTTLNLRRTQEVPQPSRPGGHSIPSVIAPFMESEGYGIDSRRAPRTGVTRGTCHDLDRLEPRHSSQDAAAAQPSLHHRDALFDPRRCARSGRIPLLQIGSASC